MQSTISFALRMPESVVNKAITGLVRLGWLKILGKYRTSSGWRANVYQFDIPADFKGGKAANYEVASEDLIADGDLTWEWLVKKVKWDGCLN